jgi:hypothetical protein
LSWGIFFGLLAAAFLVYAGTRLRLANVAEPPLPGEAPTTAAPAADDARARRAERDRRRAEREAARRGGEPLDPVAPAPHAPREDGPPTAATSIAPAAAPTTRQPAARPDIDGGTQLSFDEQE